MAHAAFVWGRFGPEQLVRGDAVLCAPVRTLGTSEGEPLGHQMGVQMRESTDPKKFSVTFEKLLLLAVTPVWPW